VVRSVVHGLSSWGQEAMAGKEETVVMEVEAEALPEGALMEYILIIQPCQSIIKIIIFSMVARQELEGQEDILTEMQGRMDLRELYNHAVTTDPKMFRQQNDH
jgi:hypothetical protein